MLAYIGRRALLAVFTVWAISVLSFAIIQLPPGDYVTSYIAQMASMGSVVTDEEAENLRIQYGLGQPIYVQYLKWMQPHRAGQLRHVDGVAPARHRGDRRAPVADGGGVGGRADPDVGARAAHRHLLGRAPVLDRRLRGDLHRLHRPRRPELPARARPALPRLRPVQRAHRRPVLAGDAGRALERGARVGPARSTCRSPP